MRRFINRLFSVFRSDRADDELTREMRGVGLDEATVTALIELLKACATSRFTGEGEPGTAADIIGQAKSSLALLTRLRKSRKRAQTA